MLPYLGVMQRQFPHKADDANHSRIDLPMHTDWEFIYGICLGNGVIWIVRSNILALYLCNRKKAEFGVKALLMTIDHWRVDSISLEYHV